MRQLSRQRDCCLQRRQRSILQRVSVEIPETNKRRQKVGRGRRGNARGDLFNGAGGRANGELRSQLNSTHALMDYFIH